MVEFLLFCIATVGMTSIIVQGVIFLPFRQYIGDWAEKIHHRWEQMGKGHRRSFVEWFNELINCAQCTGFWCGLFCGLFLVTSEGLAGLGIQHVPVLNPWGATVMWETTYDDMKIVNRLLMWFCCGLGGSFLASLGCNVIDWVFYRKMNALRQLEEQDMILAERRGNDKNREDTP